MKPTQKRPASDFPKIAQKKLSLIIESCRLPRKAQELPERARKSRILAKRLRHSKAHHRLTGADVTAPGGTWQNVIDYLTAGLKEGDFSVLDHFCEGWIQYRAEAQKVQAERITINGEAKPDSEVILSRSDHAPGVKMWIEIAGAILSLQDDLDRPPYPQEVVDSCNDRDKRGLAVADVSNADVSRFLTKWKLKGALPDKRKNPS